MITESAMRHLTTVMDSMFVPQENRNIKLSYKEASELIDYLMSLGYIKLSPDEQTELEYDTKGFIDKHFDGKSMFNMSLSVRKDGPDKA